MKFDMNKFKDKIKFDKLKSMGDELVSKVKESGVIDRVKDQVRNISSTLGTNQAGLPKSIKDKFGEVGQRLSKLVEAKKAGESGEGHKTEIEKLFREVLDLGMSTPKEEPKPEEKPELPKPPEEPPKE